MISNKKRYHSLLLISLVLSGFAFGADVIKLKKTSSWDEARSQCLSQGLGWDLPKVSEIGLVTSSDKVSRLSVMEMATKKVNANYILWVRSDEEKLNAQLIGRSIVLNLNPLNQEIAEMDISIYALEQSKDIIRFIDQLGPADYRSEQEQEIVLSFLKKYRQSRFALEISIDIDADTPLSLQDERIKYLPREAISQEILIILSKPSLNYIETRRRNLNEFVRQFSEGLEVLCLKKPAAVRGSVN